MTGSKCRTLPRQVQPVTEWFGVRGIRLSRVVPRPLPVPPAPFLNDLLDHGKRPEPVPAPSVTSRCHGTPA